ncbi:MAG: tetratricopeptide repeat protein [Myxococcota bacterium]
MIRLPLLGLAIAATATACAFDPDRQTLAHLRDVEPDTAEVVVDDGLDRAMSAYRSFLAEAPESSLTPEAMRRLADLEIEKKYGTLGGHPDAGAAPEVVPQETAARGPVARELPAPAKADRQEKTAATAAAPAPPARIADLSEPQQDFERRATGSAPGRPSSAGTGPLSPGGEAVAWSGPEEAIALYDRILAAYPDYDHNDQVLYQKARAYDELGRSDEAIAVIDQLVRDHPGSRFIDEVQFRRAEYFFVRRKYLDAEESYGVVVSMGAGSQFYELALYKLGWTFYKQELHEEALQYYMELLDHKVSTGYDFDQVDDESDERRIADTFRVISLSFSSLGGPDSVREWFAVNPHRPYEDRIYSHLGEFYLEKLRYHDAARAYTTFVDLNPLHRSSPHFGMRVVEIYEAGQFSRLVLESKKQFAETYGLQSEYWRHFDPAESPEVLGHLRTNLEDLANHYHAQFQDEEQVEQRDENFGEARRWYRAYLASFPDEPETPEVHYRLADLMLEHEDYRAAAEAYERTAYDYPVHVKAAEAGYAAIYARRQHLGAADEAEADGARRATVASTLRFVDVFPDHEKAAAVLGTALDDLYVMQEYEAAIRNGRRLVDDYPDAETAVVRDAWSVVAHSAFDLGRYVDAEAAYLRVLEQTPEEAESRTDLVDNLAASIYKQGEQARSAGEFRLAADHFLRIRDAAPTSSIRATAEYDAAGSLMELEDWSGAGSVLESFRDAHPEHSLHREATRQIAFVQRKTGNLGRAAEEYERVAAEAEDPEMRREALLLAGELYEEAAADDRALSVYARYVEGFPAPLESAVETRFRMAELYAKGGNEAQRRSQLREIVEADRRAGDARTDRVRLLAGRSALVLTELLFHRFEAVQLTQPFERSLREKRKRMDRALEGFGRLVDYEVGEVTAAATWYIAEVYSDFSRSLMESERPADISASELQDYELMIEEEAFPFEERAIAVHEKNLELMSAGVFNDWIQKSLDQLAVLVPGRYAKFETSTGPLASLDTYAYRTPRAPTPHSGPKEASDEIVPTAAPLEPPAVADAPALDAVPAAPAED